MKKSELKELIEEVMVEEGFKPGYKEFPTSLNIGQTYSTQHGDEIKILDIFVLGFHIEKAMNTQITYSYKTKDGKKGKETNDLKAVRNGIFGAGA